MSLGPREIVKVTADGFETLSPAGKEMRICAFLWTYYGYPNSNYEGVNVEVMRYRNGEIMACDDKKRGLAENVDFIAGVRIPACRMRSATPTNAAKPFARPFVKYTPTWPRSFMPANQKIPQSGRQDEADPSTRADRGEKAAVRGRLDCARHPTA